MFFLPIHFRELNASPTDVGLLYAAYNLSWGITLLLGGYLADRFDTKKVIILSFLLWIPVPLALGFATDWQQLWLPMILYGTFFGSASLCVFLVKSSPEKVMQSFGLWSMSGALAYISSPLVGGVISSSFGKQSVFGLSAVFFAASVLPLFLIKRLPKKDTEEATPIKGGGFAKNSRKLLILCCFFSAGMFFVFLLNPLIPQFLNEVYSQSIVSLGVFSSLTSAGWLFFSSLFGSVGDKHSKLSVVTGLMATTTFSFLIIALFNNFSVLCAASFLMGASNAIMYFTSGIIGAQAPKNAVGKWTAVSQASITIAGFGAPVLGGVLYQFSPALAFTLGILTLLLLVGIGVLISYKGH